MFYFEFVSKNVEMFFLYYSVNTYIIPYFASCAARQKMRVFPTQSSREALCCPLLSTVPVPLTALCSGDLCCTVPQIHEFVKLSSSEHLP